jgi:hypothetical protein
MRHSVRGVVLAAAVGLGGSLFMATGGWAQSSQTASKTDQWIHVRVESKDDGGETVRVNVPVDMAVKVLPAINHEPLREGKVRIDNGHMDDVDLRTMLEAVRTAKDGEYVTVEGRDDNVRVAKSGGFLYIHVTEKNHGSKDVKGTEEHGKGSVKKESKVEVKVPLKVVDALLSAGKDELDIVAALHALSSFGDTELVTVKDDENTVRIWVDSKNVSE